MQIVIFSLLCVWAWLTNYIYVQNIITHTIFWNTIYISNNSLSYFYVVVCVLFLILLASICLFNQNVSFTVEYLLFITLIIVTSFLLISSTNLFLTIFLLEFIALLIFGKFAVSKILFNNSKLTNNETSNNQQFSYGLFNSLFFQFWANFVSSIFLFFSLINVHYLFGTSSFFSLNFFLSITSFNWYVPEMFSVFSLTVLTTGLFIKLGLSPYQFFKLKPIREYHFLW